MRSMDTFSAVCLVIMVAVVVALVYFSLKHNKKMVKSGKIIKRDPNFIKQQHSFTTTVSYRDFFNEFSKCKVNESGIGYNTEKGITTFKDTGSWEAEFYKVRTGEGEPNQYIFNITRWRTHKGMILGIENMNILLTAIEKTFLALDPDTKVTRVNQETQTKTR